MATVFISHASADKPIVDALFDLLQKGCGLRPDEIFCTSVEGAGVDTGELFTRRVRGDLDSSKIVLLLVTPMYFQSRFCVAEMGAAWALEKPTFPLVVPGMDRELGANMLGTHTQQLDSAGLDHLRDRISDARPEIQVPTARWTIVRNAFLKDLKGHLKKLKQPDIVERSQLEEAVAEKEAAEQLYTDCNQQVAALREHVSELEKAKDRKEVSVIRTKHSSADQRYEALRRAAEALIAQMNGVEKRALYAEFGAIPWSPTSDLVTSQQESFDEAINRQTVVHDGGAFSINPDHPKIKKTLAALKDLSKFLDSEDAATVVERLETDLDCFAQFDNSDFWQSQLLRGRPLW